MAGNLKPTNVSNLGTEANYIINDSYSVYGTDHKLQQNGLFDGIVGAYNSANSFYWYNSANFIDITINNSCNIWALSPNDYPSYNGLLKVEKWNGSAWVSISVTQTTRSSTTNTWAKIFSNLTSGRYKFSYNSSLRLDVEWYIEALKTDKFLIKENGNYYTVNSINYDSTTTHNFISLTLNGGTTPNSIDIQNFGFDNLSVLTNSMTVGSDTFIPVSKFGNTAVLKLYKPV